MNGEVSGDLVGHRHHRVIWIVGIIFGFPSLVFFGWIWSLYHWRPEAVIDVTSVEESEGVVTSMGILTNSGSDLFTTYDHSPTLASAVLEFRGDVFVPQARNQYLVCGTGMENWLLPEKRSREIFGFGVAKDFGENAEFRMVVTISRPKNQLDQFREWFLSHSEGLPKMVRENVENLLQTERDRIVFSEWFRFEKFKSSAKDLSSFSFLTENDDPAVLRPAIR